MTCLSHQAFLAPLTLLLSTPPTSPYLPAPPLSPVQQLVLEGPGVDLSVTAPAATLALTLMYLRTEDEGVLPYFAPPQSGRELAAARPDLLMLRALGGALVAWGRTQPSVEWVERQLPLLAKVRESGG